MTDWEPKGAAAKLAYIQSSMATIRKTGRHAQGYDYIQEHKVIEILRPLLRDLHCAVIVEPASEAVDVREATVFGKPGFLTTLHGRIRFIDTDEPAESPDREVVAKVCGQGADKEDKGSGKAQTYLTKYAMQKLFLIPTEAIDDSDASPPAEPPAATRTRPRTTPQPAAGSASVGIDADTLAKIRTAAAGVSADDFADMLQKAGVQDVSDMSKAVASMTGDQATNLLFELAKAKG